MNNKNIEQFGNYQDVKTKTINWCTKMRDIQFITAEQYDTCVASFKNQNSGIIPKDSVSSNNLSKDYSLYNMSTDKISSKLGGENTNTIMLVTHSGLYMSCDRENNITYIADINQPNINQTNLYFILIPQTNNVYSVMNSYGKYLITSIDMKVDFSGTKIGTMASWNISKVNDNIIIESFQYSGNYLSFQKPTLPLTLILGKDETIQWTMVSKKETNVDDKYNEYNPVEYITEKETLIRAIIIFFIQQKLLNSIINSLKTLKNTISSNYDKILANIRKQIENDNRVYTISSSKYEESIKSIKGSGTIDEKKIDSIIKSIQKPIGSTISNSDTKKIADQIINSKNDYLNKIQLEINKIEDELRTLNTRDINKNYNDFITKLNNDLADTIKRIRENNIIMERQKDKYSKIDNDQSRIDIKENKYKDLDETIKLNLKIVDDYKTQTSLLTKIYPFIIVILILFLIYLIYITSIKFKENIYDKYE
jgi:hypothetical protein